MLKTMRVFRQIHQWALMVTLLNSLTGFKRLACHLMPRGEELLFSESRMCISATILCRFYVIIFVLSVIDLENRLSWSFDIFCLSRFCLWKERAGKFCSFTLCQRKNNKNLCLLFSNLSQRLSIPDMPDILPWVFGEGFMVLRLSLGLLVTFKQKCCGTIKDSLKWIRLGWVFLGCYSRSITGQIKATF